MGKVKTATVPYFHLNRYRLPAERKSALQGERPMLILVYTEIKDQDQIRLTWGLTQPNLIGVNDTVITLQPHTSTGFSGGNTADTIERAFISSSCYQSTKAEECNYVKMQLSR